ncbi:nucleotidyltransferase MB21D2-like [Branchiostoma floridae x Branchiostoma belcheri]
MASSEEWEPLDFRSGIEHEEIRNLVAYFKRYQQHMAKVCRTKGGEETTREFMENLLRLVHKYDRRFPLPKDFLFLRDNTFEGVLDMQPSQFRPHYLHGKESTPAYVVIIPIMELNAEDSFDMFDYMIGRPMHGGIRLLDGVDQYKWRDCQVEHESGGNTYIYLSSEKVCEWFFKAVSAVANEATPMPGHSMTLELNGPVVTICVEGGDACDIVYNMIPTVRCKGWPTAAQAWWSRDHYWDSKANAEVENNGYHLLPMCCADGNPELEWRLSFCQAELELAKFIPPVFMHNFNVLHSVIRKELAGSAVVSPYQLKTIVLWACDRLRPEFLRDETFIPLSLFGMVDDIMHCLINKSCANYFLPQYNMFLHCSEEMMFPVARKLSLIRTDPVKYIYLRTAAEWRETAGIVEEHQQTDQNSDGKESPARSRPKADKPPLNDRESRFRDWTSHIVDVNQGKSISVFIDPNDISTARAFRIDDKFY